VTVNAICPGFIQTDMVEELKAQVAHSSGMTGEELVKAALARVPLGRILNPTEIAGFGSLPGIGGIQRHDRPEYPRRWRHADVLSIGPAKTFAHQGHCDGD
jgi:hypothetical protein